MQKSLKAAWVLCLCLLMGPGWASEASATFPGTVNTQGTTLLLNGTGVRVRAIFKVYEMALYTPHKVRTAADLLALTGPRKLQFVALRELSGTDLGLLLIKGIQANSPKDMVQRHAISTTRLIEIFSGKSKMVPGETFGMEYFPGKGTQFYITGIAQGSPVGDAEFFNMIMRIWVGPNPVDAELRDDLLGLSNP